MVCPIPEGQKGRRIQKLHPFCICSSQNEQETQRSSQAGQYHRMIVIGMMGCPLPKITGAYSHFVAWTVKSWILAIHVPCSPCFFPVKSRDFNLRDPRDPPRSSHAEASTVPVSLLDLLAVLRHFLHHERAKHPLPLTAREVTRLPMLWGYAASMGDIWWEPLMGYNDDDL